MSHPWRPDLEHLSLTEIYELLDARTKKGVDRIVWEKTKKLPELNIKVEERYQLKKWDLLWLLDPKPELFHPEYNNLTDEEKAIFLCGYDPALWVRTFLKYEPRIYQLLFLRVSTKSTRLALRWGRRSGKSFAMIWKVLHYALSNPGSRVILITPYEAQINAVYADLWIALSHSGIKETDDIKEAFLIERALRKPIEIYFKNNSVIRMFTSGARSGGNADTIRGQEADLLVLDELAYFGDNDLSAITPMLQDTSDEKTYEKILLACSTPAGRSDPFYQLVDPDNPKTRMREYWFSVFANPLFNSLSEQAAREETKTRANFEREYIAAWGDMSVGVFRPQILELSSRPYVYSKTKLNDDDHVILGMDWDKYGAGVNLCIVEQLGVWSGDDVGKYQIIERYELERGSVKDLLGAGVREAVLLDNKYNFDFVYVDRGYGERQWEELVEVLGNKVIGVNYSSAVDELDPILGTITKEPLKAFCVDNAVSIFERLNLIVNSNDEVLRGQMISYSRLKTSVTGRPVFGSASPTLYPDHAIDALCYALLGFKQQFGDLIPRAKFMAPQALNVKALTLDPSLNDKGEAYDRKHDGGRSRDFTIRTESNVWGTGKRRARTYKRGNW